eukprot:Seg1489.4 transcript_id=Seg1489.4/GoldUCD/mRNA.D3Y31 product="Arf-GAP with SH3 domain ANK repeat and PH domain-containing protein 1" protein_id=Seg1489.4/GoldUCD/D3Y31
MAVPSAVSVLQFVEDAKQDIKSPSTSVFPSKMAAYKNMVSNLDEILDVDRNTVQKFKKTVKAMHSSAQTYITNELSYAENMEKLGSVALSREAETGIGTAFLKFSVITKELCHMTKMLYGNFNNMVLFPLDSLLKGDMKSLNDLKKPFEDSWKELKAKGTKMEKEARKKTQEIVLYRIDPPEASEETGKERKMFMYQSCEYLIKANEVKIKKGVELVQHLIEYYHAQLQYFHRGMELLENMRSYFEGLAGELQQLRTQQDDERKVLLELKTQLKNTMQADKSEAGGRSGYSLHGQQGDRDYGTEKRGNLLKRSEGVRKQWQKRYIVVKDGQFSMAHSSTSTRNVTLNLLTCQAKPAAEKDAKKNAFALVAQNRTYLFQAEDENDYEAWTSVISNAREEALKKAFGDGDESLSKDTSSVARSLKELTEGIVSEVKKLPENDICADCGAADPTWFSTNLGVLVCIECSGIHREMGVHISRIRSLTLDKLGTSELLLTKAIGNGGFNEIMEAELDFSLKPTPTSKMEQRKEFIHAKYIHRKFVHKSDSPPEALLQDLNQAIGNRDTLAVLQLYAEGVDLAKCIPDYKNNGTALHRAVEQEDLTSLHLVDFLVQNSNNIDIVNTEGNTALHIAAIQDKPECFKLLLRGGANQSLVNKDGKTVMMVAQDRGHGEILEVLKDVQEGKIQKLDNVKIDWGIDQAEGIYENPLDILQDMKFDIKLEDNEAADKGAPVVSVMPIAPVIPQKSQKSKSGASVRRSESLNSPPRTKTVSRTPAAATPSVPITGGTLGRQIAPPGQVSPTSEKAFKFPEPEGNTPFRPPPPPARKSAKQKGLVPPPASNVTSTTNGKEAAVVPGAVSSGVLSSFTPRPVSVIGQEKSPPPPTPPTRTTSSLPRPDRPAAPPQVLHRKHVRNRSDGGIIDALSAVIGQRPPQQPQQSFKKKSMETYEEVDVQPKPSAIPPKPDSPPPLPPPRPRDKPVKLPVSDSAVTRPPEPGSTPASTPDTIPMTPPRVPIQDPKQENRPKHRRARALFDCEADHDDELEFNEGDTIIIIGEADPEWLYGEVEGKPGRKGVFPINFVHVLTS